MILNICILAVDSTVSSHSSVLRENFFENCPETES